MRAFTDEELAKLLQDERAKVVIEVEKELDSWVTLVRRSDVHMIERLRDRIVGLLAGMTSPTGEQNDGRQQERGQSAERPFYERRVSEPDGKGAALEVEPGTERELRSGQDNAERTDREGGEGIRPSEGQVAKKIDCGVTRPEELTG